MSIEDSPLYLEADDTLIVHTYDTTLTPDNVLIHPIGQLFAATVIGIDLDGEPYYASNVQSSKTLIPQVERFLKLLKSKDAMNGDYDL